MHSQKIFSIFLISTLAACASGEGKKELAERTPEQRCLELEQKWDVAQLELTNAEGRVDSSWLYLVTDTFNPLTSSSNESLERAKTKEFRAHENYVSFGCMELNKMKINSAYNVEVPKQNIAEQKPAGFAPVSYQPSVQNYQPVPQFNY